MSIDKSQGIHNLIVYKQFSDRPKVEINEEHNHPLWQGYPQITFEKI